MIWLLSRSWKACRGRSWGTICRIVACYRVWKVLFNIIKIHWVILDDSLGLIMYILIPAYKFWIIDLMHFLQIQPLDLLLFFKSIWLCGSTSRKLLIVVLLFFLRCVIIMYRHVSILIIFKIKIIGHLIRILLFLLLVTVPKIVVVYVILLWIAICRAQFGFVMGRIVESKILDAGRCGRL